MRKCNRNQGILSQVCSFGAVKPVEFCREFRKAKPQFRRNEQQDAQEFLSLLLDLLHDECNKAKKASKKEEKGEILYETPSQPPPQPPPPPPPATPSEPSNAEEAWEQHVTNVDNSFFSKLLMGQSESCLTCQTCGNSSISWSSFWQLPLAVQKEKKKTSTVAAVAGEEAAANGSSVAEQGEQKEPTLTLANCISEFMETEAESAGGGKSSSDKVKGSSVPVDKLPEEQQPEEEVLVQLAQQLEIEDKVQQQQEPKEEVLAQLLQPEEEVLVQQQPKNEVLEEEETVSSQLL
ncbi:PREDICTED: ubiquitin carboxyl-terminal hydrolase 21-like [Rhagoletis zephyria]|uniref:ubiquitin carboxyl-terminal hydrolase 21-like n=1 Tax=Rhagoletis zephyria TaxID=28612 RepID=UPI0008113EA4|nr:PREDICTED: ubiquitin carboxyl-terminal hydrolase 21-like [Rhagoletis zephyria]